MTTIDDIVYYADGSKANGQVMVSWPLFQYNGTAVVAGQETYPIVDGQLQITLYANINSLPTGTYYTAAFELEEGAREIEYWIVPNLPVVTLSQIRATFPPAPGLLINALQLSGGGAQPGQVLGWNGSQWVPMYVTTINVSPNTIGLNVTAAVASDIGVSGTPATLGTSLTLNIPDAGSSSRGAVTAGVQSIGGVKTFLAQVNFTTVTQYSAYAGVSSVFGSVYFDTAKHFHMWGSVTLQTPDSTLAILQADGALLKHVDLSGGAVGAAALPGGAVTIPGMESILLPTGPNYTHGLGVDGAGNLWLGTASPTASFAYLRPDQAWVANWVDLSPYQHPSLPNTEVSPNAASIVLYKDATQWAGIGYDQNMRMWFRLGPNASGTYYYLGANQVSFANANYYVNSVLIGHRAGVNLIASSNVTLSGGDNPSNNRVDVVIAASGSLVDPTTTLGDFIVRGSAALNRLGVGSDGEVLTADSSQLLGVRWAVAGAATGGVPSTRQVIAGPGLYGGGELIADVTLGALVQSVFGRTGNIVLTGPDITAAGGVLQTRKILTGIGLSGGGDLSADRTLIGVVMGASGASHALGMVPDPGATAGVTHYLREDATWVVPPLGLADPTTSVGDLIVRGSPVIARLPVGSNGQVLTADSAQTLGVKWAVAGFSSPLTTKGDVMVYDTATTRLPVGTNGQVLTADSTQTPGLRWGAASTSFWVGGTGGAIYYNGGFVGIGTTAPIGELEVVSTSTASGTRGITSAQYSDSVHAAVLGLYKYRGSLAAPAAVQAGDFLGTINFIGNTSTGGIITGGQIQSVTTAVITNGIAADLVLATSSGSAGIGAQERMRVTGAGSVGIGTATPGALLQVTGGVVQFRLQNVAANNNIQMRFFGASAAADIWAIGTDITAGSGSTDFHFHTLVGGVAMTLQRAGNVGIGTISPLATLHVAADVARQLYLTSSSSPTTKQMRIGYDTSNNTVVVEGLLSGVGCWLLLNPTGGNVAIGNTSPAAVLHATGGTLAGTAAATLPLARFQFTTVNQDILQVFGYRNAAGTDWTTSGWRIQRTVDSSAMAWIGFPSQDLTFGAGGVESVRVSSNGKVAIQSSLGAANPNVKLNVIGGLYGAPALGSVANASFGVNPSDPSWGLWVGGLADGTCWVQAQRSDGNATPYNILLNPVGGNVGIGTSSPASPLHVNGGIRVSSYSASVTSPNSVVLDYYGGYGRLLSFGPDTATLGGFQFIGVHSDNSGANYPMVITPGGNVGIGTTNPTSLLHVAGDMNIYRPTSLPTGAIFFGNAGAYIFYNGSAWQFNPALPGGSGQPQTPWAQNINAQNFSLTSGGTFTMATLNATNISAATGIAIGPVAVPSGIQMTVDYAVKSATPNWTVGSDMRTKQNVRLFEGGLDVIRRLPPPLVAEYNGLAHTPKDLRVVSFDLEKLREVLPYTVGSHRTKLREEDAEETDILHYNIHEVVMHLILAVKQLAEKN